MSASDQLLRAEAEADAAASARAAELTIAELSTMPEMRRASALMDRVWRPGNGAAMMPEALLKVLSGTGGYVAGAFRGDRMVGVCVGLLSQWGLHSHIAAVEDPLRGAGLGRAIKLDQRAWALRRGIGTVTWTYDPLISRNAYFNLAKLGAVAAEYHTDYYGTMNDEVNAGTPTDRILVRWELASQRVRRVLHKSATAAARDGAATQDSAATHDGAVIALAVGRDGSPILGLGSRDARRLLVGIPEDAEALRVSDPDLAARWRPALRDVLGGLMAAGGHVTGFTRDGHYVVERPEGITSADPAADPVPDPARKDRA
ncbi:GNAT family N-acetyltransferase [Catenulispora pinisilvae]|uniref:GNAT family N-acetyltransferase n=1 Tax=Catenulispora pinisilvae TaxID=2705253 RepID=UPI00189252BB|nr:GNAT family N-acetyltransferase [Catenulispora pinisilvae]